MAQRCRNQLFGLVFDAVAHTAVWDQVSFLGDLAASKASGSSAGCCASGPESGAEGELIIAQGNLLGGLEGVNIIGHYCHTLTPGLGNVISLGVWEEWKAVGSTRLSCYCGHLSPKKKTFQPILRSSWFPTSIPEVIDSSPKWKPSLLLSHASCLPIIYNLAAVFEDSFLWFASPID